MFLKSQTFPEPILSVAPIQVLWFPFFSVFLLEFEFKEKNIERYIGAQFGIRLPEIIHILAI